MLTIYEVDETVPRKETPFTLSECNIANQSWSNVSFEDKDMLRSEEFDGGSSSQADDTEDDAGNEILDDGETSQAVKAADMKWPFISMLAHTTIFLLNSRE